MNPELPFVDSSEGIERLSMNVSHDHDEETEQEPAAVERLDPHVWMSPANGKVIAANILNALSELDPDHADVFQANAESLYTDIDELDANIKETLSGIQETNFMVFHPAFGYFAHDYGLVQIPVQVEGQDPSASELAGFVDTAREHNIKVVFVQPSFSTEDAEAIAQEIGGKIEFLNPLAEDWLSNMQTVADAFAATLTD